MQMAGMITFEDGRCFSIETLIIDMATILQLNADELLPYILQILSSDEKDQHTRFRKILEESRKKCTEKGVPTHLQNG